MNTETKDGAFCRVKTDELFCDISCDYVLPDYNGDVRKILFTEAVAAPTPAYVNGDSAELVGQVDFKMVYTDSEGRLSVAEFSKDYEMSCKAEGKVLAAGADVVTDGYSMRLVGPRKISAKARVEAKLTMSCESETVTSGSAFECGEVETAKRSVDMRSVVFGENSEREYADEIIFMDGAISDEVEVPFYTAECSIAESKVKDGEVWLSGDILVSALIKNGEEPLFLVKKSIPFAESFSAEGVSEDMALSADVCVTSLKVNVNPTDTGTSVTASVIAEFSFRGEGNCTETVITDAYMKDREVVCSYGDGEAETFIGKDTVSESFEAKADMEALDTGALGEVIFVSADAKIKSVEISQSSIDICSEIRFAGIACEVNDDSTVTYVPVKHTAEYTKRVNNSCQNYQNVSPEVKIKATRAEASVDGGAVVFSAEVCTEAGLYEKKGYKTLVSCDATDAVYETAEDSRIYVYYPDAEDTLFSVAKKFRTTAEKVAVDNALTEAAVAEKDGRSSLLGIDMLIIK